MGELVERPEGGGGISEEEEKGVREVELGHLPLSFNS